MYVTDSEMFFTQVKHHEHRYHDVVLSTGQTVVFKVLRINEFERINDLYQRYGGRADQDHAGATDGSLYTVCSLLVSMVHPETHERLFSDIDVPRFRDEVPFNLFSELVTAFDRLHNTATQRQESDDPIKKPSNAFQDTDASSTV